MWILDEPSDEGPLIKQTICKEITGSGFFQHLALVPIDAMEIYNKRTNLQYIQAIPPYLSYKHAVQNLSLIHI